jgi:photosystem II stability/assembly factor-like uncharacterized protein
MLLLAPPPVRAQEPSLWQGALHWRNIGPFRGGRAVAAVGVRGQENVFYVGVNNGGVWKTDDYGRTWSPIFDGQSTGSVGAIAVAESDPNVIYVGSGEGLQRPDLSVGNGMYRSSDGGRTWTHLGLTDAQQVAQILVDPRDPNTVLVAVLGHPYGPNEQRGVFRSTDGGQTWRKVLYKDENTGAMDLAFDPASPDTLFAVLWAARQRPWEADGNSLTLSANNGLYRSSDGGITWAPFGAGLPTAEDGLGRIGLGTCPSEPRRMYAIAPARKNGGLYRSDDGGASWRIVNRDARLWGRDGDFSEVKVDPKNPDVVYAVDISSWKSTDGGVHFVGFKGAPGGDDPHRLWINPWNPRVMVLAGDQGAAVTVNGGDTWSSWYNQSTAQFYHVITDDQFPYRVYGGQQESGSAGILSRGNDGQITFRDWHPVGAQEYGYIAPDPLHPNIVYGGKVSRYDMTTGDVQNVAPIAPEGGASANGGVRRAARNADSGSTAPEGTNWRFVRTEPLLFSPVDPHILYYAGNVVFKTLNGGQSWTVISPDLTREHPGVPANLGAFASEDPEHGEHRGVVYTIGPSFTRVNLLWAGTDDGLIWVTHDGGAHWTNVTPPALTPWSKVSLIEASHTDTLEAYAAINRFRLDDIGPHVYRTKDGGTTWTEIVDGLPNGAVVNAVREDPRVAGLLFAGTELGVFVGFDDGDHWQPLQLNLPVTSVRDVWIHESDLVAGTHGRGFWILDDIEPLRDIARAGVGKGPNPQPLTPNPSSSRATWSAPRLYSPELATRVRWNRYTDTPLPWDEPGGENPPDGAIIQYWLPSDVAGPVVLEILDSSGHLVRRFSSDDPPVPVDSSANEPLFWARPWQPLLATPGAHRFIWDLRYPVPPTSRRSYPISAIIHDTPLEPRGVWVLPGRYTVRLTVGGRSYTRPMTVRMDPRLKTTPEGLRQQFDLAVRIVNAWRKDSLALAEVRAMRARLDTLERQAGAGPRADSIAALDSSLAVLAGAGGGRFGGGRGGAGQSPSLASLNGQLGGLYGMVEGTDAAPTPQASAAVAAADRALGRLLTRWAGLRREAAWFDRGGR